MDHYLTDWNDPTTLYETVVEAVASVTGRARSTIGAEYDHAHARTLRDLFDPDAETRPSTGVVKFVVASCTVSVHSDGRFVVEPPDSIAHDAAH
jgi:hypothetical protein